MMILSSSDANLLEIIIVLTAYICRDELEWNIWGNHFLRALGTLSADFPLLQPITTAKPSGQPANDGLGNNMAVEDTSSGIDRNLDRYITFIGDGEQLMLLEEEEDDARDEDYVLTIRIESYLKACIEKYYSSALDEYRSESSKGSKMTYEEYTDKAIQRFLTRLVRHLYDKQIYDSRARSISKLLLKLMSVSYDELQSIEVQITSSMIPGSDETKGKRSGHSSSSVADTSTENMDSMDLSLTRQSFENELSLIPRAEVTPTVTRLFQIASAATTGGLLVAISSQLAFTTAITSTLSLALSASSFAFASSAVSMSGRLLNVATGLYGVIQGPAMAVLQVNRYTPTISQTFGLVAAAFAGKKMHDRTASLENMKFETLRASSTPGPQRAIINPIPVTIFIASHYKKGSSSKKVWGFDEEAINEKKSWHHLMEDGQSLMLSWLDDASLASFRESYLYIAKKTMMSTAIDTVLSSLFFALPITVFRRIEDIDNPWKKALDRAQEAGVMLAHILLSRRIQEDILASEEDSVDYVQTSAISLVGYGMGAAVIFYCLKTLASIEGPSARGIIENAILIGAPVESYSSSWKAIRAVVSNRLVNAYSENDLILSYMARSKNWTIQVAGLQAVDISDQSSVASTNVHAINELDDEVDGYYHVNGPDRRRVADTEEIKASIKRVRCIENLNLSHLIRSQAEYPKKIDQIMSYFN
jgi:hypothetical protein